MIALPQAGNGWNVHAEVLRGGERSHAHIAIRHLRLLAQSVRVAVVADRVRLRSALDADRDAVIGLSRARGVKFQTPNVEYVRQAPLHVPKPADSTGEVRP